MRRPTDSATTRRLTAGAVLAVLVVAGLIVHALPGSAASDIAGDALYAGAVYSGLALIVPRVRSVIVAAIALAWCAGVELLQLTGIPLALETVFPPAALVLGSGFDTRDLVVYAVAVLVAWGVDAALRRSRGRDASTPE